MNGDANPATVVLVANFRNEGTAELSDSSRRALADLLKQAKEEFEVTEQLRLPQEAIFALDCRKSMSARLTKLVELLKNECETERTRPGAKAPQICGVAAKLVLTKQLAVKNDLSAASNAQRGIEQWSGWGEGQPCRPVMSRTEFDEHVLGVRDGVFTLQIPARGPVLFSGNNVVSIAANDELLRIVRQYLHDAGLVLWFDNDGLRDTVVLCPGVFTAKVLGAFFRPSNSSNQSRFSVAAAHANGMLVTAAQVATTAVTLAEGQRGMPAVTLQLSELIGESSSVEMMLSLVQHLGLCHKRDTQPLQGANQSAEQYLFPGAIPLARRRPQHAYALLANITECFFIGRMISICEDAVGTTIFSPGLIPRVQAAVLDRFAAVHVELWSGGLSMPPEATGSSAEAGVQLRRCCGIESVTIVVRSAAGEKAAEECRKLLEQLCEAVRGATGNALRDSKATPAHVLVESALEPHMLARFPDTINDGVEPFAGIRLVDLKGIGSSGEARCADGISVLVSELLCGAVANTPMYNRRNVELLKVPDDWEGHPFARGGDLYAVLPSDTPKYNQIQENMRRSLPSARIIRIDRVQNKSLWVKYDIARAEIAEHNGGDANEIEAWHSTGPDTDPALICEDWRAGFDLNCGITWTEHVPEGVRFRNDGNKSYGTGLYFAEHAIYPDAIMPHKVNGCFQMHHCEKRSRPSLYISFASE